MSEGIKTEGHTDDLRDSRFRGKLKVAGRLVASKSIAKPKRPFIPIDTAGKPLSEIVIEERK